jgi:hypothetical protein
MTDAPKRLCARAGCAERFVLVHRAGRNSGRARADRKRRFHEGRIYCSGYCRRLASRVRRSRLSDAHKRRPLAGTSGPGSTNKAPTPYQPSQNTKEAA